jgi:hypothetical protein
VAALIDLYSTRIAKSPMEKQESSHQPDVHDEDTPDDRDNEKYIFCRQCYQVITSEMERIDVQGCHKHTFANPHGLVFEIGCFRLAPGCIYSGKPVADFTWFSGYKWQLAACGKCLVQMGWRFVSSGSQYFNGLILDRLIFPQ